MTAAELAAYIGAAAWFPQIAAWLYKTLAKPTLTIIPEDRVELGFTPYGPIFNLRIALAADRRDLVVKDFRVYVEHEDGERHTFRWAGMQEELGETRDAVGIRQGRLTKEQERPIALKIGTVALVEKFMRFQEPKYRETDDVAMQALVTHFNFLKGRDADFVQKTLDSKELHDLVERRTQFFWWKPGRYTVTFDPISAKSMKVVNQSYSLTISQLSADKLRRNIPGIRAELEDTVRTNLPDFKMPEHHWQWAYEELKSVEK